jgi:hypothetical protein
VVVRRHVRYIDGKPAIISDDYFDERIVEGTELAEPEDTTRENILAEAGYEQVYDIDEIITRMPTPAEVERLGISTGTPVAEHIRTGYTAENRPVQVMVSIIPGDTLRFSQQLSGDHLVLELREDECGFDDVADRGRTDRYALQDAPPLGHQREAAFALVAQGPQQRVAGSHVDAPRPGRQPRARCVRSREDVTATGPERRALSGLAPPASRASSERVVAATP